MAVNGNRFMFPRAEIVLNGNVVSHPFLEHDSPKDIALLKLLFLHQPYAAPHGSKLAAWELFLNACHDYQDSEGNTVLLGVSLKALKDHMKKYEQVASARSAAVPFRSGHDAEEPPNETMQLLEEFAEHYSSCKVASAEATAAAKLSAAQANVACAAIRDAALGHMVARDANGAVTPTHLLEIHLVPEAVLGTGEALTDADATVSSAETTIASTALAKTPTSNRSSGPTKRGAMMRIETLTANQESRFAQREDSKRLRNESQEAERALRREQYMMELDFKKQQLEFEKEKEEARRAEAKEKEEARREEAKRQHEINLLMWQSKMA
jgi:hypothetical protein